MFPSGSWQVLSLKVDLSTVSYPSINVGTVSPHHEGSLPQILRKITSQPIRKMAVEKSDTFVEKHTVTRERTLQTA